MADSRVCPECGREKPLTREHWQPERAARDGFRRLCRPCLYSRSRANRQRSAERLAQARKTARESARRTRAADPERHRNYVRRHREKVKADPALREARNEAARIRTRLKAEREGRGVAASPVQAPVTTGELIPSAPLAAMVERLVAREKRADLWIADVSDDSRQRVCERLGLNERTLYAMRVGERPVVDFAIADEVLTRADLLWFDVFNEQTVRAGLAVGVFAPRAKRLRSGRVKFYRERIRTRRYGDWGPDLAALALVEAYFTGVGLPEPEEQLQLGEVSELRPVREASRAAA